VEAEDEQGPSILVIATWYDEGNFRARVTRTDPADPTGKSSAVVDTKPDALRLVAEWLASIDADLDSRS
jgi:hypothetical protein